MAKKAMIYEPEIREDNMEVIDLRDLLKILQKKLWIVILTTILFTAISGLVSYYILAPEYQAFTTLMIGKPQAYKQGIEYEDVLLNQKLVSTYGEIAKSRVVANEFMSNLGLSLTYKELDKKIEVKLVSDTEIIKISVKDNSAEMSATIANEIAKVFIKHVARIMNIENIQLIDKAEIPLKPIRPMPVINMAIAAVLGIMLSTFFIFLREYFDNTVKTQEDIESCFMLPVLGLIPEA
ncbi:MAG TPA: Wzz/FepE/Etk N-terminal domain-containing protein [Bacillota bacterium]|nr:Wzz/FepE/Etk N-terminal domain-containing protein [Bacillota bacterium]HPL52693.1 Wzz/FepE/Etk N-terminal domain-containing protein [Bacillota bacterium]